jgi:hypothetical protein
VKLVRPKSWKIIDGCAGVGAYCGHSRKQHRGGKGHCTVSQGEWICWCRRWKQPDDNRETRRALLRIAKENRSALLALAEIVDPRTRRTLVRLHRELDAEIRRLAKMKKERS